jgi:signal transduction histidine kinase
LLPISTFRKQLIQFTGIALFILASAIVMVLWQGKNQRDISDMAANHQLIIVNSVKIEEELANMQLHLIQEVSASLDPDSHGMDLYGGQYNPVISRHTLQSLFNKFNELQAKTGSLNSVSEKLESQFNTLLSSSLEVEPGDSDAADRARLQLQSLTHSVDQLEKFHSLRYKELTRVLDTVNTRDNRNLLFFLVALALLSYLLIQWALISVNRSLDQQQLSERELLRSQQQLNNLLTALPDSVLRLNSNGKILESRGRQTILASANDNIVGKTLAEMPIPAEVQQGLMHGIQTELTTSQVYIYEYDLPDHDQTYEARIIKFRDDEVICIVRDVTAQEVIRREQEKLTTELESKNAELERFVYTVSHDLKTPLVTINGYIGLLQQAIDANDVDRINSDLMQITRAANSMAELLDGLLELSRVGHIINPPEAGSLGYLVRNAVDIVREKMVARGIELEIDDDMPQYWGDSLRLLEVFQNLLENAIKFMGDQPTPRIRISAVKNDSEVICKVQDNGIGIDPRYHDRIFNLFERLNPEIEGTGIGMSLVHRIIKAHGGTISVESVGEQQGCTIVFSLPVKPE